MSDLFDEVEDGLLDDDMVIIEETITVDQDTIPDVRRRLENMREEKRLRDELQDFSDY